MLLTALGGAGAVGGDRDGQVEAMFAFQRGCELGFEPACGNYRVILDGNGVFERARPTVDDYPIVLRGVASGRSRTGSPRRCMIGLVGRGGWTLVRPASDDEQKPPDFDRGRNGRGHE